MESNEMRQLNRGRILHSERPKAFKMEQIFVSVVCIFYWIIYYGLWNRPYD